MDGCQTYIQTDSGFLQLFQKPHSLTFPVNHTKFPDLYRHTFQYRMHTMTCNTSTNYALQCMLLCSREQRTEINGQSMSMMWPTLGLRTAKEQNRTEQILYQHDGAEQPVDADDNRLRNHVQHILYKHHNSTSDTHTQPEITSVTEVVLDRFRQAHSIQCTLPVNMQFKNSADIFKFSTSTSQTFYENFNSSHFRKTGCILFLFKKLSKAHT